MPACTLQRYCTVAVCEAKHDMAWLRARGEHRGEARLAEVVFDANPKPMLMQFKRAAGSCELVTRTCLRNVCLLEKAKHFWVISENNH